MRFCDTYRPYFSVARHNVSDKARSYLAGLLMKAPRKNMERMEEYVADYDYQSQQQFLTDSPWDYRELNAQVGQDVDAVVGGTGSALLLDESCFEKKGNKSVGVARQWNGRLGKIDNCQVGVYAALSDGKHCGLVDYRLYLPKCWTQDLERCEGAKIPETERRHKSKGDLALEMVDAAQANGLRFGWLAMDAGYGRLPWLLRAFADRGHRFVADVGENQTIYTTDPKPYIPRRKNDHGRPRTKLRTQVKGMEIQAFFESLPEGAWHRINIRKGTKGILQVQACRRRVWLWDGDEEVARCWWAVCVRDGTGEIKWFLSNAPEGVSLTTLVRKHAIRFWIERTFQDGKTSVGMADYQVRGWQAWHHHMSMVMLALLFMLRERKMHQRKVELLSCQDIVELLNHYLPRADTNEDAVLRNITRRHQKRKRAIQAALRRKKRPKKHSQT